MKELTELVTQLVKALVDDPDTVTVETYKGDSIVLFTVKADSPKTLSFLIGKKGSTVSAMRHLVRCLGARLDLKTVFEVSSLK
ncbi:KH domain-containing protein [bacterium]|nr:KH domain-containing protein [bacterium]